MNGDEGRVKWRAKNGKRFTASVRATRSTTLCWPRAASLASTTARASPTPASTRTASTASHSSASVPPSCPSSTKRPSCSIPVRGTSWRRRTFASIWASQKRRTRRSKRRRRHPPMTPRIITTSRHQRDKGRVEEEEEEEDHHRHHRPPPHQPVQLQQQQEETLKWASLAARKSIIERRPNCWALRQRRSTLWQRRPSRRRPLRPPCSPPAALSRQSSRATSTKASAAVPLPIVRHLFIHSLLLGARSTWDLN